MAEQEEKILYYNVIPKIVRKNGDIAVDKACNGVEFVNIGGTVVTINQRPLNPPAAGEVLGDSYTMGGNKGEIFAGRITISFATNANPMVLVTEKVYMPGKKTDIKL